MYDASLKVKENELQKTDDGQQQPQETDIVGKQDSATLSEQELIPQSNTHILIEKGSIPDTYESLVERKHRSVGNEALASIVSSYMKDMLLENKELKDENKKLISESHAKDIENIELKSLNSSVKDNDKSTKILLAIATILISISFKSPEPTSYILLIIGAGVFLYGLFFNSNKERS